MIFKRHTRNHRNFLVSCARIIKCPPQRVNDRAARTNCAQFAFALPIVTKDMLRGESILVTQITCARTHILRIHQTRAMK